MSHSSIKTIQLTFASRLDTLGYLLKTAADTFEGNAAFLERRLAPDMATFGTQIAYTCNQPRNFALWSHGKAVDNLDANVLTIEQARNYLLDTKALLMTVNASDAKLAENTRIDLLAGAYAEMSGAEYVNEFLMPNFYFHFVTAYGILRMAGVNIGKRDYMLHMMPFVRQA